MKKKMKHDFKKVYYNIFWVVLFLFQFLKKKHVAGSIHLKIYLVLPYF